jgi:hypothetical protein
MDKDNVFEPASAPPVDALATGDRIGFFGAALCAVHCALLPVVAALLPALGISVGGYGDIDQAFVLFASVLGISTVAVGYRRHRVLKAAWLLAAGLVLLWVGSFTALHNHGLGHALVMTVGGGLLASAHLYNLRLGHRARR